MTIDEIRNLIEEEAKTMLIEEMEIKEHNIYFVDFDEYFGYSCLVFKNNHHIYFADDFELHHKGKTKDELKAFYIKKMNNILFTEAEITAPITEYTEYDRKRYYLNNYYGMQVDYISIFGNPKKHPNFEEEVKGMIYNPVAFAYMYDAEFVIHHSELYQKLQEQKEKAATSYEYLKNAFLREMYNHEYGINWQADYDTLSAFYNIQYHDNDLQAYFNELNFNDTQKQAYLDARKQYYREQKENENY